MKFFYRLFKMTKKPISNIDISNKDVIDCEIETPQFKNNKIYKMYKQRSKLKKKFNGQKQKVLKQT